MSENCAALSFREKSLLTSLPFLSNYLREEAMIFFLTNVDGKNSVKIAV